MELNRNPTKRWQEAKAYTYDGDDWGAYEDHAESPRTPPQPQQVDPPKITGFRQRGQSLSLLGNDGASNHDASTIRPPQAVESSPRGSSDIQRRPLGAHAVPSALPLVGARKDEIQPQNDNVASKVANLDHVAIQGVRQGSPDHVELGGEMRPSLNLPSVSGDFGRASYVEDTPPSPSPQFQHNLGINTPSPAGSFPPRDSSLEPRLAARIQPPQKSNDNLVVSRPDERSLSNASEESDSSRSFIRPADIYKRIEEEREKERRSSESGRSSLDSAERSTRHTPEQSRSRGTSGSPLRNVINQSSPELEAESPTSTPRYGRDVSVTNARQTRNIVQDAPLLPKLDRLSGFGTDLWGPGSTRASTGPERHSQRTPSGPVVEGRYVPEENDALSCPVQSRTGMDPQLAVSLLSANAMTGTTYASTQSAAPPMVAEPLLRSRRSTDQSQLSRLETGSSLADISPIMRGVPRGIDVATSQAVGSTASQSAAKRLPDSLAVSQSNSPARSPAFENNSRLPQPAIAELGATTPAIGENENEDGVGHIERSRILPNPAHEHDTRNSARAPERSPSPSKSRVRDLTNRYNDYGEPKSPASSIASWTSSNNRSVSPEKGRVRGSESIAHPAGELTQSPSGKDQRQDDPTDFRPKLPGEWISYTTADIQASDEPAITDKTTLRAGIVVDSEHRRTGTLDVEQQVQDQNQDQAQARDQGHSQAQGQAQDHGQKRGQNRGRNFDQLQGQAQSSSTFESHEVSTRSDRLRPPVPVVHLPRDEDESDDDLESERLSKDIMRSLSPARPVGTNLGLTREAHQEFAASPSIRNDEDPTKPSAALNDEQPGRVNNDTQFSSSPNAIYSIERDPQAVLSHDVFTHDGSTAAPGAFISNRFSWEHRSRAPNFDMSSNMKEAPLDQALRPNMNTADREDHYEPPQSSITNPSPNLLPGTERTASENMMLQPSAELPTPASRNISGSSTKPIELPTQTQSNSPMSQAARPTAFSSSSPPPRSFSSNMNPSRPSNLAMTNRARSESKILGFQDILALKSSQDRIQTYKSTRAQFAAMHTGLEDWLKYMLESNSEYAHLVEDNANAVTADATTQASTGRPRRMSQSSGFKEKDVSQSAGAKATSSVKGFLNKSRNRFRATSSDKAPATSRSPDRRRTSVPSRARSTSPPCRLDLLRDEDELGWQDKINSEPENNARDTAKDDTMASSRVARDSIVFGRSLQKASRLTDPVAIKDSVAALRQSPGLLSDRASKTSARLTSTSPVAASSPRASEEARYADFALVDRDNDSSLFSLGISDPNITEGQVSRYSWGSFGMLYGAVDSDAPPEPWQFASKAAYVSGSDISSDSEFSDTEQSQSAGIPSDVSAALQGHQVGSFGARGFGLWEKGAEDASSESEINPAASQVVFFEDHRAGRSPVRDTRHAVSEKEVCRDELLLVQSQRRDWGGHTSMSSRRTDVPHSSSLREKRLNVFGPVIATPLRHPSTHAPEPVRRAECQDPFGKERPVSHFNDNIGRHFSEFDVDRPVSPETWNNVSVRLRGDHQRVVTQVPPRDLVASGIDENSVHELASDSLHSSQTAFYGSQTPQRHTSHSHAQTLEQSFVRSKGLYEPSSPLQHNSDKEVVAPKTRIRSTVRFQDPPITESISKSVVAKVEGSNRSRSRLSFIRSRSRSHEEDKFLKADEQLSATQSQHTPVKDEATRSIKTKKPAPEQASSRQRLKRRSMPAESTTESVVVKLLPETQTPPKKRDSFLGSLFKRDSAIQTTSYSTSPRSTSGNDSRRASDPLGSAPAYATTPTLRDSRHTRTGSAGLNQHPVSELDFSPSAQASFSDFARPTTILQSNQDWPYLDANAQDFLNSSLRNRSSTLHSDTNQYHSHIAYLQNNNIFPRRTGPTELDLNPHAPLPPSGDIRQKTEHLSNSNPFSPSVENQPPLVPPKSPSRSHYVRPSQDDIPALPKLPPAHSPDELENQTNRTPSRDACRSPRLNRACSSTLPSNHDIGLAMSQGVSELEDEPVTMSPTSWPGQEWRPTTVLT